MSNTFWRMVVLDLAHMRVRLDWDENTRTVAARLQTNHHVLRRVPGYIWVELSGTLKVPKLCSRQNEAVTTMWLGGNQLKLGYASLAVIPQCEPSYPVCNFQRHEINLCLLRESRESPTSTPSESSLGYLTRLS